VVVCICREMCFGYKKSLVLTIFSREFMVEDTDFKVGVRIERWAITMEEGDVEWDSSIS